MPDGDYYRRTPARIWKSVHRMLLAGASPDELASPVRQALAHTLRQRGGLPGLMQAAEIVSAVGAGRINARRGIEDLRALEKALGRSPNASLGVEGARRVLAEMSFGGQPPMDAGYAVAERACWELLEHHFLALAAVNFLGGRFANLSEVREWEAACRAEFGQDVRRLAADVVRRPTAEKLRAPARRRPRQGTAALLHQPVAVGAGVR